MVTVPGVPWSPDQAGDSPRDAVLVGVLAAVRGLSVRRLIVSNPTVDDNVWYIERDSDGFEVQMDTHLDGCPPFYLESDRQGQRMKTEDVQTAIDTIVAWIRP